MKRIIIMKTSVLMILLSLFMMPLLAQPPGGGQGRGQGPGRGQMTEEDIKERIDNLAETLECTDQQKEKLLEYEIAWNRKMQTERAKIQSSGNFDREAFRARMQEQRELRDEKYKEILTDAQMIRYNKLREERMQQRQSQREGQGDGQSSQRQRGRN